jgi:MbtH protein
MDSDEREDTGVYKVVVDHEEMYSIWPADSETPLGWSETGKMGTQQECLDYIKELETDRKPRSTGKDVEEHSLIVETGGERGDL